MSKEVIFHLLHSHVIKILEEMGRRNLAYEVEKEGMRHPIYDYLDKAFSIYYAEYGGVNCRWLREAIEKDIDKIVRITLPYMLRQYIQTSRARREVPGVRREIAA